jgi:uncharacterized membrane protein YqhA
MQESIFERFIHSKRAGWIILRLAVIVGPILGALVLAVAVFVEAWRY